MKKQKTSIVSYFIIFCSLLAGEASIIFSHGRDLLIGDIHGRSFEVLVESQNRGAAVGVDFHYHLQRVFWTDTVQDKVNRNFMSVAWELIEPQAQSVDSFSLWGE